MKRLSLAVAGALAFVFLSAPSTRAEEPEQQGTVFAVRPIGHVKKTDGRTLIVLNERYQPGLLGLEGYSHIYMFWWFDRNDTPEKRSILRVHPRGNRENPLTGVDNYDDAITSVSYGE